MRKFSATSERVKSVDLHPTEPWIIAGLYNGMVYIYNYQTQTTVKQVEASDAPVRSVKFIARKQWFVTASDDMMLRVFNLNTLELVHKWEAHAHFIRGVAVHPTQPYILSCSDDMKIKLWNWEKSFQMIRCFEGHNHYVMHVVFNPKDLNTFASASLDRTVKVWGLGSSMPNFTLEGHEDGVNSVDYYLGGDKPYLVSGADDRTVKVWDYQTKACIQTLEGHTDNVTSVAFHPELPLIISGSEDGGIRLWNNTTYRLEKPLNYGWDRAWTISCVKGNNGVALGFDKGTMFLKMGKEIPSASMDATGKIVFAKHSTISGYNVQQALANPVEDGERLVLGTKELGNCEFYPQSLKHNNNGRFIVATGDGEYIIYTALQVRSKKFGNAVDFVWDSRQGGFAIRDHNGVVVIHDKNFEEVRSFKPDFHSEAMFGGTLIGIKGTNAVCMYDWAACRLVRKIDVSAKQVIWSESGDQLVITTDTGFYILKYDEESVQALLDSGNRLPEDGIENAFEVLHEVPEKVRSSCWVGDCFIYTNGQNVIKYCVGKRTDNVAHLDRTMYILGYLPKYGKLILIDKAYNVVAYTLRLSVVNFQTAVLRGDLETAKELLPSIPENELSRISQFLETCDMHEWALELTTDLDHKFDLAIQLQKLDLAKEIATKADSEEKWRQIGDLAMQSLDFELAEQCMWKSEDFASLLMLFSANGDVNKMNELAQKAKAKGKFNIAFTALLSLNKLDQCIDLLINTGRIAEAAFMARSYAPSKLSSIVDQWKNELARTHPRQAHSLADPQMYGNLFPELNDTLADEKAWRESVKFVDAPAKNFVHLLSGDNEAALVPAEPSKVGKSHQVEDVPQGSSNGEMKLAQHQIHHESPSKSTPVKTQQQPMTPVQRPQTPPSSSLATPSATASTPSPTPTKLNAPISSPVQQSPIHQEENINHHQEEHQENINHHQEEHQEEHFSSHPINDSSFSASFHDNMNVEHEYAQQHGSFSEQPHQQYFNDSDITFDTSIPANDILEQQDDLLEETHHRQHHSTDELFSNPQVDSFGEEDFDDSELVL